MRESTMRENTIDPIEHTHADPKDGPPPRSWLDRGAARLVALAIAIGLAAVLVLSLGDDVQALVGDGGGIEEADLVVEDPAMQACIDQRAGDVDAMLADGILSEAQHASFRARAIQLCEAGVQSAPRL